MPPNSGCFKPTWARQEDSSSSTSSNTSSTSSQSKKTTSKMSAMTANNGDVHLPENKMSLNLALGKKRELERERGSTTSASSNSITNGHQANNCGSGTASITSSSSTASKLSKIGKRLRDSCRNLRGKQSRATPEDFGRLQAGNDSNRSKHYVAMDFTGKEGRILNDLTGKGVQGLTCKDGYAYFRRKVCAEQIEPLLTEVQSTIHLSQPWFHRGVGRDLAQRILATHAVDGAFLVRDSSVAGGFVISYSFNNRTCHAQVLPDTTSNALGDEVSCGGARVFYSLDEGKTKFFDLLQMVEYYQLNKGSLNSRLTHYIVRREIAEAALGRAVTRDCSSAKASDDEEKSGSSNGSSGDAAAATNGACSENKLDTEKPKQKEADKHNEKLGEPEKGLRSNGFSEMSMDSPMTSVGTSSPSPSPSEEPKDYEKSKRSCSGAGLTAGPAAADDSTSLDDKMDTNHNTKEEEDDDELDGLVMAPIKAKESGISNGDDHMISEGD